MIKVARAQFLKLVVGAMVDVNMSPMPPKVIRKEACLGTKVPSGLLKDPGPKRCPNTLWRGESKEMKDSVMVEDGGVHCNIYNGHCMIQKIRISKPT
jgi:hypothetical protein